jgi:glycosyltransferase involved in cell wall biosynthesis
MSIRTVDIAICTWNRARLLSRTLESLSRLNIPDGVQLSVILVDNNSTDETLEVVETFGQTEFAKRVRFVFLKETQQGHTFARNRSIEQSTGDLILWTDDDVLVCDDWVAKYVAAADGQPEMCFWGSQIEPCFEAGKPKWIQENWHKLSGCFAARDLGNEFLDFSAERLPYGANFAVRGDVQRAHKFDSKLGRRAGEVLGEDELELMRRLLQSGHSGRWLPGAKVQHLISADRTSTKYVYDYFVGQGRKLAIKGEPWHTESNRMRNEARSEYRKYWLKRFFVGSDQWCSHLLRSALAYGQWQVLNRRNAD